MENELLIQRFLDVGTDGYGAGDGKGDGKGYGYGDGSGYGTGYGFGDGYGDGTGDGNGAGDGDGYGYGDGSGYGTGDGDGDGYGDGKGYGDGYGDGKGYGDGLGSGDGFGDGTGDGNGAGDGDGYGLGSGLGSGAGYGYVRMVSLNGQKAYSIDGMPTLIDSVKGNFAIGGVIQPDLSVRGCYIARVGKSFAHGDTLRKAFEDATRKDMRRKPVKERVAEFKREFPEPDRPYPNRGLYTWHGFLTGSCRMGRDEFARARGIDVERGSMTVREFIGLTRGSYGGESIAMLAKAYGIG